MTSEYVFVGFPDKNVIHQYTFDGHLVQEHGTKGSGVGGLNRPLLTGCDSSNNILIAGNENHRLDVLRADGSFCTLPVHGLKRYPMCARMYQGKLYVMVYVSSVVVHLQVFSIA